jgi:arylsulfatase A-like enzyme
MTSPQKAVIKKLSYWQVFRLVFVIFSLYLMGDAFYRWDGLRYYASFSEFLPSVALVTILWSITASFFALLVWSSLITLEWFCSRMRWNISGNHFLLFICTFILLGITTLFAKRLLLPDKSSILIQITEFLVATSLSIFILRLLHSKTDSLMVIVQKHITPLVLLFGIWVIISLPFVSYYAWVKKTDTIVTNAPTETDKTVKNRPNIILVTYDALSARNMSVYGYYRPTTPFISKWSEKATLFTRAEAESGYTLPTTSSMMTGKRVWTHQAYASENASPLKINNENMALVLKNSGYYNMAFIANNAAYTPFGSTIENMFEIAPPPIEFTFPNSLLGFIDITLYRLFGEKIKLHNWIVKEDFVLRWFAFAISYDIYSTAFSPTIAFNRFLAALDKYPPEPFFAWIHLYPPHGPYLPDKPFMGMFDSSPELRTLKSQNKAKRVIFEESQTLATFMARYDEFIRYCDKSFEDCIEQLKTRNKLKNTVIILSADHGEVFTPYHVGHGGVSEPITHIPFIIKEPEQASGRIINYTVEQIDMPATILDLAGIQLPQWMEGRSLVPLMNGKKLPSRPAFSMELQENPSRGHQITNGEIAVWEGEYKLIHHLNKNTSSLFNLKLDPEESNNLFKEEPELSRHLLTLIKDNLKQANQKIITGE